MSNVVVVVSLWWSVCFTLVKPLGVFRYLISPLSRKITSNRYDKNNKHNIDTNNQSSWWLNQPIWKICSSKWVHLPQFSGWKFHTNIWIVATTGRQSTEVASGWRFIILFSHKVDFAIQSIPSIPLSTLRLFQHTELEHTPSNLYQRAINWLGGLPGVC